MSWYRTGTVSVTNSSAAVVGSGTSWLTAIGVGWGFVGPDGRVYEVQSVNSDVSLTLARNYGGTTASGQQYDAYPTQSELQVLAADVAALIADYAVVRDTVGSGQFPNGSAAAPAVSFASDVDTGFYRYDTNSIGVATSGQLRYVVDAAGNIGVGAAPGAWTTAAKAVEFAYPSMGMDGVGQAFFAFNLRESSPGSYVYKSSDTGVMMRTGAGGLSWLTAPAGTIGASASLVERMQLSGAGNLGLGSGISAWQSGVPAIQMGNRRGAVGALPGGTADHVFLASNAYASGSIDPSFATWRHSQVGASGLLEVGGGRNFSLKVAPSGAADSAITWQEVLHADYLGNVVTNVNSAAPALGVNGQIVFSLTSNTNLRVSVRGTDGVTRVTNLTLA